MSITVAERDCGCSSTYDTIEYCATHATAPEMLEALRLIADSVPTNGQTATQWIAHVRQEARAIIRKATGE